jgi:hypothetical protein
VQYLKCNKFTSFQTKSSLLKVDDVGNVCEEAPLKLANSLLLFCKGLGWLTSVALPGVDRKGSTDGSVSIMHRHLGSVLLDWRLADWSERLKTLVGHTGKVVGEAGE